MCGRKEQRDGSLSRLWISFGIREHFKLNLTAGRRMAAGAWYVKITPLLRAISTHFHPRRPPFLSLLFREATGTTLAARRSAFGVLGSADWHSLHFGESCGGDSGRARRDMREFYSKWARVLEGIKLNPTIPTSLSQFVAFQLGGNFSRWNGSRWCWTLAWRHKVPFWVPFGFGRCCQMSFMVANNFLSRCLYNHFSLIPFVARRPFEL